MTPETQRDIFAFLARPEAHGAEVTRVDQVHTHISAIFMGGDRVLKLKRAVRLPFVDFTDVEVRRKACEREVSLNAPGAPDLYLGTVPVTREADGRLAVDGDGQPEDWLVVMRRFDQQNLFSRLLGRGELTRDRIMDLAVVIADHLGRAEVQHCDDAAARMRAVILENRLSLLAGTPDVLNTDDVERWTARATAALGQVAELLDRRGRDGRVRRCHGDLHLRNICLWNDRPTLFDAIEFSESLAVIDTLYDLAFLLMDLDQRGFRRLASILMNRVMEDDPDPEGLAALPLFLSVRAVIRAHVSATVSQENDDPAQSQEQRRRAVSYMDRAMGYLAPAPPRLLAVGGLSGSGKSRLARELAPLLGAAPGALVSRTDVLRKRLMGVDPRQRLQEQGYAEAVTRDTYRALMDEVRRTLRSGHAAIADGVFARPEERAAIEQVAREEGVPFTGLWLSADPGIAARRIGSRSDTVSDATPDVLTRQQTLDLGDIAWPIVDTSGPRRETMDAARAHLGV